MKRGSDASLMAADSKPTGKNGRKSDKLNVKEIGENKIKTKNK